VTQIGPRISSCLTEVPRLVGHWGLTLGTLADFEDHGLRPACANSLQDPISKTARAKWIGGVAQTQGFASAKVQSPKFGGPKKKRNGFQRVLRTLRKMPSVMRCR
jgi:hypothetical protein